MKTSWHIKSVSKKRAQVLRATFDDQNKEEKNSEMVDSLDQFLEDDEIDRKN